MKIQTGEIPVDTKKLKAWAKKNAPSCPVFNPFCVGCQIHRIVGEFIWFCDDHQENLAWMKKAKFWKPKRK